MAISSCPRPLCRVSVSQDGLKALDKATEESVRQLLRNPPLKIDDDVRSPGGASLRGEAHRLRSQEECCHYVSGPRER